jgi:tRNA threonylcarbamoyladenosine modification (KEOPS) complex  Pcc1 subunit
MSMHAKATIRLGPQTEKQLTSLLAALSPETRATATRRAAVRLEKENHFLVLSVEAEDTVALRATLNAYLRWINSALAVIENLEDE